MTLICSDINTVKSRKNNYVYYRKACRFSSGTFPCKIQKYVRYRKNTPVIYVFKKKALYGMMSSFVLFYKHFRRDMEKEGF